jgi:transposase-like protein
VQECPRVINTDGHAAYPPAVAQLKTEGALAQDCRHRPVPFLNSMRNGNSEKV